MMSMYVNHGGVVHGRRSEKKEFFEPYAHEADQVIEYGIDQLWKRQRWYGHEIDQATQWKIIGAMQARYVFPDYLSLIGEPSADDYADDGELTLKRKAELMLLGKFEWQGMVIAKHECVFGRTDYWGRARWHVDQQGWYVASEPPEYLGPCHELFLPLFGNPCRPLMAYLADELQRPLESRELVLPIDGNPFNAHPENLRIINGRGRPMRCKCCDRRVTPEASRRFKLAGVYQRYCIDCMETIAAQPEI